MKDVSGDLPPPLFGHSATLRGHEMWVYGGCTDSGEVLNRLYMLDLGILGVPVVILLVVLIF